MRHSYRRLFTALILILLMTFSACGQAQEEPEAPSGEVATSEEMTEVEEVGREGMIPVTADQLIDGTYEIRVDSSSSMFNITACELTVRDGSMTAVMTMSGTGYRYICMANGEEAANAPEIGRAHV